MHPLWPKIFSISCVFFENFGKIIGWHPFLLGILDPLLEWYLSDISMMNINSTIHKATSMQNGKNDVVDVVHIAVS